MTRMRRVPTLLVAGPVLLIFLLALTTLPTTRAQAEVVGEAARTDGLDTAHTADHFPPPGYPEKVAVPVVDPPPAAEPAGAGADVLHASSDEGATTVDVLPEAAATSHAHPGVGEGEGDKAARSQPDADPTAVERATDAVSSANDPHAQAASAESEWAHARDPHDPTGAEEEVQTTIDPYAGESVAAVGDSAGADAPDDVQREPPPADAAEPLRGAVAEVAEEPSSPASSPTVEAHEALALAQEEGVEEEEGEEERVEAHPGPSAASPLAEREPAPAGADPAADAEDTSSGPAAAEVPEIILEDTEAGEVLRPAPPSTSFRPDADTLLSMMARAANLEPRADSDDVHAADAHTAAALAELQRFLPYFGAVGIPARGEELTEHYYTAMEALYVHHNTTLFAERVMRGVALTGHGRLHLILGVLYAHGLGVTRSEARAVLHYTFAAVQGIPEAHVVLGYRHSTGLGVPQSCPATAMHLREAADAVAMTYDGRLSPRPGSSLVWASADGHGDLHTSRFEGSRRGTAYVARRMDGLHLAAERGSGQAALQLGLQYMHGGPTVRRDLRAAERYFLTAIRLFEASVAGEDGGGVMPHLTDAYALLGMLYVTGDPHAQPEPLPRSFATALMYFRNSTARGVSSLALNGLGYLHAVGYLRNQLTREERLAAGGGRANEEEEAALGGAAVPDFATAAKLFESGAVSGSMEARYNLGVLHLHGRGVPLDVGLARRLFTDAAREGSVLALWQLGVMAETSGDCARAVAYYERVTRYGSWHDTQSPATDTVVLHHEAEGQGAAYEKKGSEESPTVAAPAVGQQQVLARLWALVTAPALWPVRWARGEKVRGSSSRGGDSGGSGGVRGMFGYATGSTDMDPAPVVRLVESLALAEMGVAAATRDAAELLDESIHVAGEDSEDEQLVYEEVVEADNPSFAKANRLPAGVAGEADAETIVLRWVLPTVVRFPRQGGSDAEAREGDAYAVPWLLSQREAKRLLLLRLLRLGADLTGSAGLRLGNFYYYGESPLVGSDASIALHYYNIAATQGSSAQALFNVGFMHQLGIGVPAPLSALLSSPPPADGPPARGSTPTATTVHMNPVTRPWVPGRPASDALVAAHHARVQAAPFYVLEGVLRLLEGTLHTTAPQPRAWRYEGDRVAGVDLVAAAGVPEGGTHHPAYYYYDLHLAKRAYDSCLLRSRGTAYAAVWLALTTLNVQWWALHFGRAPMRGVALHAAARLAEMGSGHGGRSGSPLSSIVAATPAGASGGPIALARAVLEGVVAEFTSALLTGGHSWHGEGGGPAGSPDSHRHRRRSEDAFRAVKTNTYRGQGGAGGFGQGGLMAVVAEQYRWVETCVLVLLSVVLFVTLLVLHMAQ